MSAIAATTFLFAAQVEAETLPALFKVTGLADGDILNVRAKPSAKSEDVGDLPMDAQVEVLEYDEDSKWARIIWQEGNGWLATRYLAPMARVRLQSGLPVGLTCNGNEPFWSLELQPTGGFAFSSPEGAFDGQIDWSSTSYNFGDSHHAFGGGNATGVLQRGQCSDTMSDRSYGWSLDLVLDGQPPRLLSGCCFAQQNN